MKIRGLFPIIWLFLTTVLVISLLSFLSAAQNSLSAPNVISIADSLDGPAAVPNQGPPTTPPDVSKISVGAPDIDGYATVTGSAGAVPGDAAVAVINLSTRNVITATATSNGAFSANLFAPSGSSVLVKYSDDPALIKALWQDALNPGGDFNYMTPLPGATIFLDGPPLGGGISYHSAGFFGPGEGPDWAGWWLEGEVTTAGIIQPGSVITVSGTLRATSPVMNCSNPPPFTPQLNIHLVSLFGANGTARIGRTGFNSYLFTPTGLPIEHEAGPEFQFMSSTSLSNRTCLSQNTFQGDFSSTFSLPSGLADGVYKLEAYIFDNSIPLASGVRRVVVWSHFDPVASLPPLTVGTPQPPRVPWTLFANYPVNGHRGVQAVEDVGRYQLLTRTTLPPHRVVVPMRDARSGNPIPYRLEPGSNWLSGTDRRFPNPPVIPLSLPGGTLQAEILKPNGSSDVIGPVTIAQSSVRTPSLPDGTVLNSGTGHPSDIFHLYTADPSFAYTFDQYGPHTITLTGQVEDVYGNSYPIGLTYEVMVARVLDLDPAQLPTTPYKQGDAFAPGLHLFPPVPADVNISLVHMPFSDPAQAQQTIITGQANRFGYFQPPAGTVIRFTSPGEFRVDISAEYVAPDGTYWAGYTTWGNVVENSSPMIEAHGRRGMDYATTTMTNTINDMPIWFLNENLPPHKIGIENYYPFFSGDIHWGDELANPTYRGDSIHSIITLRDLTGPAETIYNLLRLHFPRATNRYRQPPTVVSLTGLDQRLAINEAPLFMTTISGGDPTIYPNEIDMWGYWYGSSERPDVHVREIISEDGMGTAYWRFDDTYVYQIGEPANGDQPGDLKWEFGGVVFRVPGQGINQYAIYSSLWTLLPHGCDAYGCARVTPPFQDATGAGINGGPIMTLLGQDVDMLFLPKGVRPGDVLEVGDTVAFSGHVGPPLDSRVGVTITSPSGVVRAKTWHANKIGWLYDPTFDFTANEPGRWTVDVIVEHDRPYIGNGAIPQSHNMGTVLGTSGRYEFYVVNPAASRLFVFDPEPGIVTWISQGLGPIMIRGLAPSGTTAVRYTVHDKGIVMDQGSVIPDSAGYFSIIYDPETLHDDFPMLSLFAHEGVRQGLADEVAINMLAIGGPPAANTVTLISEEIFIGGRLYQIALPAVVKQ